ncbi:hypothetical protein H4582DRAFT_234085 [Lactarius indigo]|nr:hypothetical protein H4582DRAFT_234085 [Lactarius indigo]
MSSSLMEQCSPSAYGAIIDKTDPESSQSTRLNDSRALVQLHRKFWLKGVQDMPENESMDIDKDEDADEDEDGGDETGPGYILNLGIPRIQRSVLWVRKEYIWLYGYCDKYLESLRHEQTPPSVVVTGQPGIGKSYWVTYALCRRLAEGKPVICDRGSELTISPSARAPAETATEHHRRPWRLALTSCSLRSDHGHHQWLSLRSRASLCISILFSYTSGVFFLL